MVKYISGNWEVIADDNNKVYDIDNSAGSAFPGIDFGSTVWKDYVIYNGCPHQTELEFRRSADVRYKYVLSLEPAVLGPNYTSVWNRLAIDHSNIMYNFRPLISGTCAYRSQGVS